MPRLIETADNGPIMTIEDLVDYCDSAAFDPACQDSLAAAAPMLRALSRNRRFLADFAIAELKQRCAGQQRHNPYSAQVLLLRPPTDRYVLRAAFWPAMQDHVVRMSGPAPFLYHVPHDHGFDFLTVGYLGPGYGSDYYEYDGASVVGAVGESVSLRYVERSYLSEGKMLLYRANRDIHAQLPPQSLSVSLNILASNPDQGWRRQYRFDLDRGAIAQCMTLSCAQMLLELAVGCGDGRDLAEQFAHHHPDDAMRLTAWTAIGEQLNGGARHRHHEQGTASTSPLIRDASDRALHNIHYG